MSLKLDTPVQYVKGVGPKLAEIFHKREIQVVQDLLEFYPRGYEDRRAARNIASLVKDEVVSLKAQVAHVSAFSLGKSARKAYDVTLKDETGTIHCKYFRVPYKGYFERFRPHQWVRVVGKVSDYRGRLEFHHPDLKDLEEESPDEKDALIPLYTEIEGLSSSKIRRLILSLLEQLNEQRAEAEKPDVDLGPKRSKGMGSIGLKRMQQRRLVDRERAKATEVQPWTDLLPQWALDKFQLLERFEALQQLHQPPDESGPEYQNMKSAAHRRVIFEEFFWLELFLASQRSGFRRESAPQMEPNLDQVNRLVASLPFQLTGAQQRAFKEVVADVTQPYPMHRLVQGDVGSGKTLVALMAAVVAVTSRLQVAMMAPTEILAEQHFQNAKRLLGPLDISVGLLTGQMKGKERQQLLDDLRDGHLNLLVGTHALIQDDVEFQNLGLVIIDEQHRFGVHQRNRLKAKGLSPHFLIMTATPIPRTLAMTVYGDLDVSVIDEMPAGRMPIQTRIIYQNKKDQALDFLRVQVEKGRQAYIVYPLVEESEKIDLKDAVSEYQSLTEHFPQFRIGLLHGKMKSDEKDEVMERFRRGEVQILVSTTVIEVGVDVPNANLMIIEHAERFGLSQLHQLRGRVGRGAHKSFCILVHGHAVSEESRVRTKIMEETTDGFKIAEADLEIRGPGEFLGSRQSGLAGFKMANLVRDVQILQEARSLAFEIIEGDSELERPEHEFLRAELTRTHGKTALASVG